MREIDFQIAGLMQQDEDVKNRLYTAIVENNLQSIALVDEHLRFVTANSGFCRLLGLPGNHQLNQFHLNILPFSKEPDFQHFINELIKNGLPGFELTTELKTGEGNRFLHLKMVRLENRGRFDGGVLTLTDTTQARKKQLMLEQKINQLSQQNAQQERLISSAMQLENFVHIAAHDLREPLRIIGNFSQLLAKRCDGQLDQAGKDYLAYIMGGVLQMDFLINDLLLFSRLETMEHQNEHINLNDLFLLLKNDVGEGLRNSNGVLEIKNIPEKIWGSQEKIRQLFQQLLENAIKFRKPEVAPIIRIEGVENEKEWQFSVTDNGIGIPAEFQEKIFSLFRRLHGRQVYPGNGVGLALCQKIVAQHGGEIWVEPSENHGSTFHFTILKP